MKNEKKAEVGDEVIRNGEVYIIDEFGRMYEGKREVWAHKKSGVGHGHFLEGHWDKKSK